MVRSGKKPPIWMITNGWREIFARIFTQAETQFNVTPDWLVNPATNRRLKLDLLYPDLGVAVRLEGLQGKQRRQRPSLEEEAQQRARDAARQEVCRAHGIELITVNLWSEKLTVVFRQIDAALSRARQRAESAGLQSQITRARATAANLGRKITDLNQLKLYADLWEDRQYQAAAPEPASPPAPTRTYTEGMEVEHTHFGPGVVINVAPSNGDTLVTVDFITAGPKTLAASLIGDKLLPR